jgi:hypothetical protein
MLIQVCNEHVRIRLSTMASRLSSLNQIKNFNVAFRGRYHWRFQVVRSSTRRLGTSSTVRLPAYRCVGSRYEWMNGWAAEGDVVLWNGNFEMSQASMARTEFGEGQGQVWMQEDLDESSGQHVIDSGEWSHNQTRFGFLRVTGDNIRLCRAYSCAYSSQP